VTFQIKKNESVRFTPFDRVISVPYPPNSMRLLRTDTLEIVEYHAKPFPPYVILSHRWDKYGD